MTLVRVDKRFKEYGDKMVRAIDDALYETGKAIERDGQAMAAGRGNLEAGIHATRPFRMFAGRQGVLVISEHPGRYQHEGTYRKLGARMSTRGRADTSGEPRGVKPIRYLRTPLLLHRRTFYSRLRSELGSGTGLL